MIRWKTIFIKKMEQYEEEIPDAVRKWAREINQYDSENLLNAFDTYLWKEDSSKYSKHSQKTEIDFIREYYLIGYNGGMDQVRTMLNQNIIVQNSIQAIEDEEVEVCAKHLSNYPHLKITDEAREQLQKAISEILTPTTIMSLPPLTVLNTISFFVDESEERIARMSFGRNPKLNSIDNKNMLNQQRNGYIEGIIEILRAIVNIENLPIITRIEQGKVINEDLFDSTTKDLIKKFMKLFEEDI